MAVTAAQVKELRERTGAGMMECKKALEETGGNIDQAIENLRKSGQAKADKKANRIAAEGTIIVASTPDHAQYVMIEINSETDFVGRDENFLAFANNVAKTALAANVSDLQTLATLPMIDTGLSIEEARQALIAKVGEKIHIRRVVASNTNTQVVGAYIHSGRIGVLVELEGGTTELARDIAMHIAASKPLVVNPEDVSSDVIAKEKEIYMAQAIGSGKPQEIIEKMVNGRLKKYLDEISLVGQPFVKDPDILVSSLLNKNRAKVLNFTRFEVGEGIEKEEEDFVGAVMAQVHGS